MRPFGALVGLDLFLADLHIVRTTSGGLAGVFKNEIKVFVRHLKQSNRQSVRIIASVATLFTGAAANDINVADYSIAAIEYRPTPFEKVGKVQAGLLCLPKGKLRWRDVARPEDEVLAKLLTEVLGAGGLSVAARADPLFGDSVPLTRYRIKIVVERVKLRLCVAGLGIGEKQPSGEGMATVRWETYDRVARAQVNQVSYEVPMLLKQRDARGASGVISDALVDSATRFAASRTGAD